MEITLHGRKVELSGEPPQVGDTAPDFVLTDSELKDRSLSDFLGKNIILNIFPSIDTHTCATSTKIFNDKKKELKNTFILCISMDLPFANRRFCQAENMDQIILTSDFRHRSFGQDYGLIMINGPLAGLLARAVIFIDQSGIVRYLEIVPELSQQPDYLAVLKYCSHDSR